MLSFDRELVRVSYDFVSEEITAQEKYKKDVISYAGRLLEIAGARTMVVALDNNDRPFVLLSSGRLVDPVDSISQVDL